MPVDLPRVTVRRAMVVVAWLAVLMGLARVNLFLPIFAGCITVATFARSHGAITRRLRSGLLVTRGQRARVVVSSMLISTIILGLSDLVFFIAYSIYGIRRMGYYDQPISQDGIFFGILVALFFTYWLRRRLWPCEIGGGPQQRRES